MKHPSKGQLVAAIADATRAAVSELFRGYPDHHFYYCSLITSGEGHAPTLCAWSLEALASVAEELGEVGEEELQELKWSYADSPFYGYGDHLFGLVRELFDARPPLDVSAPGLWQTEISFRLGAMEAAMAALNAEGLFGTGARREGIVINVEVMPPDHTNTERALRLNPRAALVEWLREADEP